MNKILEFIRKHSKITVILIILCSLLPLIIVHILFKWNSGIAFLVAEWSAGELLGYIGTLLSFWGTIILGWLALQASNKANELSRRVIELEQDHYRLEMRPFVLVSNWKAYLDAHGLKGGIVRNDATTDELCICMEHYSDDIGSDDWVLLENILG